MKNIWKLSGALSVVAIGLAGCGGGSGNGPAKTNGTPTGGNNGGGNNNVVLYDQQERLARPVVNEVLATVAERRHRINNIDNPTDDAGQLANDIRGFMKFPAGRSDAITNVVTSVLVPDVMKARLVAIRPGGLFGRRDRRRDGRQIRWSQAARRCR